MPEPPAELRHLFFARIPRGVVLEDLEVQGAATFFGNGARITIQRMVHVDKRIKIIQKGHGNVANIADYMAGVTNAVSQNVGESAVGQQAKELVKALATEVAALAERVDKEHAEQMGSDLTRLSEEMAKSKPRRAWYEVSLKGLKEGAEAAGAIAKPVLDIVSKLTPLLLGS
ncbi:MAG TPA: hypothetical protein VGQ28_17545 [Thermoanaerobaculia bacterium]|nr:hypothetical protein [Thermoanaerobaculia bacterium]